MSDPIDYDALRQTIISAIAGPNNAYVNVVSGLIAGTLLCTTGVIAGHPFDTVKVRLQTVQKGGTTVNTFVNIIFGLYKGMTSPLIGVATINACLFGVYGQLMQWQRQVYGEQYHLWNVFVAGCGSGLANSVISCPSELAKIQLQNQIKVVRYKGPWACLQDIYKRRGFSGCYRGMTATVLRETPSYGVYFWSFEAMQRLYEERSAWKLMLAGGVSGVLGWMSTYPLDVAKTRIQAIPIDQHKPVSTVEMLMVIRREEGIKGWFRGINATIVRAFPTNAVIFYTYAWSMDMFSRAQIFE